MTHTFSYNIYKNEYDETMIAFFKSNFEVEEETERILTLTNLSKEDCMNIASCMFKSAEECKSIFPVKTIEEEMTEAFGQFKELKSQMCDIMLKVMNTPAFKAGGIKNISTDSETFSMYENMFYIANEMTRMAAKH